MSLLIHHFQDKTAGGFPETKVFFFAWIPETKVAIWVMYNLNLNFPDTIPGYR
jgi:hypothetical protein